MQDFMQTTETGTTTKHSRGAVVWNPTYS